mmetsp:Transcript_57939/g.163598  ORF Transcript_57939/g.163598 Transcript_57939/m.163598 type:complete len:722 (-) Transcript_57939:277-2442(-)
MPPRSGPLRLVPAPAPLLLLLARCVQAEEPACVALRTATATDLEAATAWACANAVSCGESPPVCGGDPYSYADWVFSKYYVQANAGPETCSFGGAAALSESWLSYSDPACVNADAGAAASTTTTASTAGAAAFPARPPFAEQIRGISWGPIPVKSVAPPPPQDDWMALAAKPTWGRRGRSDLGVMAALGANMVRLYGNSPDNDHTAFLDEALSAGLHVTPGLSDFPFTQQAGNCQDSTNYNCYSQIKDQYLLSLQNGFMGSDGAYHSALAYMIVINEPDLKIPSDTTIGGASQPRLMCRAIISAVDAMLDAEREAGLTGPGINFTATFSFAVCLQCSRFNSMPALGQTWQLEDAMLNPTQYGYQPRNNLAEFYRTRWTHSFNTQNTADVVQQEFLSVYEDTFRSTPVFIGEYHSRGSDLAADIPAILELSRRSVLFAGISFFQYQVAYSKGGHEMEFGMFGLGDFVTAHMPYFGSDYSIFCLVPVNNSGTPDATLPAALAFAYGGRFQDPATLCIPNPYSVPLDDAGYDLIRGQVETFDSLDRLTAFNQRIVEHLGGAVRHSLGLVVFTLAHKDRTFADVVEAIAQQPDWTAGLGSEGQACVVDRDAFDWQVSEAVNWICGQDSTFNCAFSWEVPQNCTGSIYDTGDFVFSKYYKELVQVSPLRNCYFNGSAIYANRHLYGSRHSDCTYLGLGEEPPISTAQSVLYGIPLHIALALALLRQ